MKLKKFLVPVIYLFPLIAVADGMPSADWLANLRSTVGSHMCAPASPLMKVYKEPIETCPKSMESLFDKCTKEADLIKIPEVITSVPQANQLGQIIAECISANYMGGQALDSFIMLQKLSNKAAKPNG